MSNAILESGKARNGGVLVHLSEEFQQVIARIQEAAHRLPVDIEPDRLVLVESAERTVDARALDLQLGQGNRAAWQAALSEYETAWLDVIRSLGERKN